MVTGTEAYWDNRFGWFNGLSILGNADLKDSYGQYISSVSHAQSSSGDIVYAQIYLTPYDVFGNNDNYQEKVMVHELGHVLGLGHSDREEYYPVDDSTPSIMKWGYDGYRVPQTHDINDLENKY